jgi:hypothetical protein
VIQRTFVSPRVRARAFAVMGLFAASIIGNIISAPDASAWTPYCGPSKFIEQIEVAKDGAGNFKIIVYPTPGAREYSAFALNQRDAVVEEWHAIQACVSGLYGPLADSIWQQLECHQVLAWAWAPPNGWLTGPTYDLESWRPPLDKPTFGSYLASKSGGYLGKDPGTQLINPFRPDAGQTDLEHALDNIA